MPDPVMKPIKVTQPLLPDLMEINRMIQEIWDSKQLSNNGNMVQQLEKELAGYLNADYLSVFSNGTTALQIACRLLNLTGEVITTPFTFPATIHALAWSQVTPVFCDIEEKTFHLNADQIESLITDQTTAIMPVHVFGNPCDVDQIQRIADQYGLKVIYDAAHAFGVKYNGKSIASFGDITMFSFHATKVYHTIEGGALTFHDPLLKQRADEMRNFGIMKNGDIMEPGINAKLNEVQAAVGLLVLAQVDAEMKKRKEVTAQYTKLLGDVPGVRIYQPADGVIYNYPYFVITIDESKYGLSRDKLYEKLAEHQIYARKYFYPLCSNLHCYSHLLSAQKSGLPVANQIAASVLALPLYGELSTDDVDYICSVIHAGNVT